MTDPAGKLSRDLLLLVGVALALRLAFAVAMPRVIDSPDAIHYLEVAKTFPPDLSYAWRERIPPLYPALGALTHLIIPDVEWACVLVSLLASVLLPVPVYLLARAMHGRGPARVAGLAVGLWPWLADYSVRVAPESLAMLLWFFSVYALARAIQDGGHWMAAAPLGFFALHLARPEGTFLMLAAPIGAYILCRGRSKREVLRLAAFASIAGALIIVQILIMRAMTGHISVNPRLTSPAQTAHYLFVLRGKALLQTLVALWSNVLPIMVGPYLLLFAGAGLFTHSGRSRNVRLELFLLFFAAVQSGMAVLSTHAEPRYLMAVVIAASLWAARGVVIVADQAGGLARASWLRFAPMGGLVAMMLAGDAYAILPEYVGAVPRLPVEYKVAGCWMKEHLPAGLILTRKPQIGFYAGMRTTGPAPEDSVSEAVERAARVGAKYLVVDERYTTKMAPGLAPLLDPANAPAGLRLLKADLSPYPAARIVIYEIR